MKSSFRSGDRVITNRLYKKRHGESHEGKVLKNTHFGRFVVIQTDQGEISIKPEYLELAQSKAK